MRKLTPVPHTQDATSAPDGEGMADKLEAVHSEHRNFRNLYIKQLDC